MNHIYRLCLNGSTGLRVAVPESAKCKRGGARPRAARGHVFAVTLVAFSVALAFNAQAGGLPTGGQVVSGSAQIQQGADGTVITQTTPTAALNWQSFDIAADKGVRFEQPSANSVAVNRVVGNTASDIQGRMDANGQVWLINPNGVLFGKSAQVNVGGLVASTLDTADPAGSGDVKFSGDSAAKVVNKGKITAADGGYVALLGKGAINQGVITARLGTVALGAGSAMTLTFTDNHLLNVQVTQNQLDSLAANHELIVADGGRVFMSAGARDSLVASAVNNTGVVQAQTVEQHDGKIVLMGGMQAGTTSVAGTLDASAPSGGNGGSIETSAAQVKVADGAKITTRAKDDQSGTWLIDPTDFTVSSGSGAQTTSGIGATTLGNNLQTGNVAIQTANAGTQAGDINVNADVSWTSSNALTLTAQNNVNLNANITAADGSVVTQSKGFVAAAGKTLNTKSWTVKSTGTNAADVQLGSNQANYIQYNAGANFTNIDPRASGNGVQYSAVAPTLAITGFNAGSGGTPSKSYDGTTNLLPGNLAYTLNGGGSGDTLNSVTGGYSQSDAGTNLTVNTPTASSAYGVVNGSTQVFGYTISGSASSTTGVITPANLTVGIVGPNVNAGAYSLSKVYDGTNSATLNSNNYQITGLVNGQSITVNQPSQVGYGALNGSGGITGIVDVNTQGGTMPNGGPVQISAIFSPTNFTAGAGTKLSNYNLTGLTATGTGAITPAPVYLGGVVAQNKTYDATTSDPINKSNANIFGIVNNDAVTLDSSAGVGNFADANAGTGKAVTLSGFTLTGSDSVKVADYKLILPTLTADIDKRALAVYGATVADKIYDGSTATTAGELNLSAINFTGTQGSDSLKLDQSHAAGNFSQADVGNNLGVTVSGVAVLNSDGSANNNYVVGSVQSGTAAAPTALIGNITPRPLTISFSGNPTKIYDGSNYATLSTSDFSVANLVPGQTVAVTQAPATYTGASAPNVGSDQVTAALQSSDLSFTNGAKAGNYTFNTLVTGTGSITPAPLTLTVVGNPSKVYDGTDTASFGAGNFALSGVMQGQSINLVGPFSNGHYYNGSPSTPESNAGTWGVSASVTNANYTAGNGTLLTNYTLPSVALGWGTITPRLVAGGPPYEVSAGITGASKVYDGNTSIALGQSNFTFTGFLASDGVSETVGNVTGTFATKNVGTQPISALLNNGNVNFTCGGGGTACLSNYTYDGNATHLLSDPNWAITAYGSGNIFAKTLYITLTGVTKQYDGNNAVLPLNNGNFIVSGYANNDDSNPANKDSGWVSGEGAAITPTASFTYASPNVSRDANGTVLANIGVTGTLTQNNYAPNSNTELSNYNLVYDVSGQGAITPAPLSVSGIAAQNKIYDGGTGALINIANGQLAGLADVDKNAGAITLNIGNSTASSADGILGSTGGTLVPTASGFAATGSPVSGTFGSANVNAGTQNIATAFSLSGTSAGNYTLEMPTLTAQITPRPLTISGISANDKTYDATTAATFTGTPQFNAASGTGASVTGLLTQDSGKIILDASDITGKFASPNANVDPNGVLLNSNGRPIDVTATGFAATGDPATLANYSIASVTNLQANIKQAPITLALGQPIKKGYDGTTSVTIPTGNNQTPGNTSPGYHTSGWVGTDDAIITQTHSAAYSSPNATVDGNGNPIGGGDGFNDVTANLVSSDWQPSAGTSLSNYALPSSVTGHVGQITPVVLNLNATRVYDATSNIYASIPAGNPTNAANPNVFGTLSGVGGDQLTVSGQGVASSKNVGAYTGTGAGGSPINGQGFNLGTLALVGQGSANANNYTLIGGTDSYTITPAPLAIDGGTVESKVYDGTKTATVTGATLGGVVAGDTVALNGTTTGTFASANANIVGNTGTSSTPTAVTIANAQLTGADGGNYTITTQNPNLTGTIWQRQVTLDGSRQYDGSSAVNGSSGAISWKTPGAAAGDPNSGVVSGDTIKVNGGSGSVASANVGTYHSDGTGSGVFTATGLTLSNANYMIAATGNTFQVNPHQINLTGSSVYNGSTTSGATSGAFTGVSTTTGSFSTGINGETLDVGGAYTLANSGNVTPNGNGGGTANTQTTTTPTTGGAGFRGLTIADGSGSASNYVINKVTYTVNPVVLSFSGTKTYDGSSSFDASTLNPLMGGFVNGDQLVVSGAGTLSSANAGSYGTGASGIKGTPTDSSKIGVGGLTLSAATGNSANANNYTLIGGTDTYSIVKAQVYLTGVREYDGTQNAAGGNVMQNITGSCATSTCWVVGGVVGNEWQNLTVTGTASGLASANVGSYGKGGANGDFNSAGLTLGGTAAGNYTWVPSVNGDAFIVKPYVLSLNGTRVYDQSTSADASLFGTSGVLTGVNGETVALTGSGVLSSKNVNGGTPYTGTGAAGNPTTGQGFNLGTLALTTGGTGSASNYTLVGGSDSLILTPKSITVAASAADKQYDGTTTATVTGLTSSGVITGDTVTFAETGANFSDPNAGNGKTVTVSGISAGGTDAGNYAVDPTTTTTANITKAPLTITANDQAKTYDGVAYSGGNGVTYSTFVNGENQSVLGGTLRYSGDSQGAKNVKTGGYTITPEGYTSGNYSISYVDGTLTINPASINLSGTRSYDGTTAAGFGSMTGVDATTGAFSTGVNGETLVLSGAGDTGNRNVGSYAGIAHGSLALGDDGTNLASNYVLNNVNFSISKARITISTADVVKTYDGTTSATGTPDVVSGQLFGGDKLNNDGTFAYTNPNAGTGDKTVTVAGVTINDGNSSGNYDITYANNTTSTINQAPLTVTADDRSKTYGDNLALGATAFTVGAGQLQNGETVNGATLTSANNEAGNPAANAGTYAGNIAPSSAIGANGFNANNYAIAYVDGKLTINPYTINLNGSRGYAPGDTSASAGAFTGGSGLITGANGEQLALTGNGRTSSPNAGTYTTGGSTLNIAGLALGNNGSALASNYVLGSGTFTINPLNISLVDLHGQRAYDGTNIASAGDFLNNGYVLIGSTGEYLSVTGQGTVASPNVQRDSNGNPTTQNVTLGTLALANGAGSANEGLASNYVLDTADLLITPAHLTVTANDQTRTYDGTAFSGGNGVTYAGFVNGENPGVLGGTLGYGGDSQGARNVRNGGYAITPEGYSSNNYAIDYVNGTLTINPATLTITTDPVTKTYDGTTDATGSPMVAGGTLFGGDNLSGGTYAYTDPNAGTGKTVTVGGVTVNDGNGGNNYVVSYVPNQNSTIDPRVLDLDAQRLYDGTSNAPAGLYGNGGVIATGIGGQTLLLTGLGFTANPDIEANKLVSLGTLAFGDGGNGGMASNYKLGTVRLTIAGGQPANFGVPDGLRAWLEGALDRTRIPTPYGLTGTHAGNNKKRHVMVERNVARSDFISDLALSVVDGGVKLPSHE